MNGDPVAPLTKENRSPVVTETGAILRTASDVLNSPSRQQAAAVMAALSGQHG